MIYISYVIMNVYIKHVRMKIISYSNNLDWKRCSPIQVSYMEYMEDESVCYQMQKYYVVLWSYIWTNNSAGQMLNYENALMMFQISALLLLPLLVLYNTWNHWKTWCTLEMDLI